MSSLTTGDVETYVEQIRALSRPQRDQRRGDLAAELARLEGYERLSRAQEGQRTALRQEQAAFLAMDAENEVKRARVLSAWRGDGDAGGLRMEAGAPTYDQHGRSMDHQPGRRKLVRAERLRSDDRMTDWIHANGPTDLDVRDVDEAWQAYARGMIADDWREWRQYESRAMSTAEPGGGYLVPDVLAARVIDRMRASTPIFAAGAQIVPMTASTLDIARVTGDPTAGWHAESAAITPSDVTLDRVRFTARTLPVLVKTSRELAEDAPNLGQVVQGAIAAATGAELTRVALRGSGTAPEPRGILNQTGVTLFAIGLNGGPLTHDMLIDRHTDIATANATPSGVIWHPRTAGGVAKFKEATTNAYMPMPSPVAELPRFPTSVIPANLAKGTGTNLTEVYVGDWSQLLIGMRATLRIEPLRERYADTGEIAFLSWLRADVQLEHGGAFSVITDTTT